MKITAVIAEYNPFHNGHRYHLDCARRVTGADAVIVLMSGDFVQRGEPAVADKYARAEAALSAGADAVFMMPVNVSTGSAEVFASGAVTILERMNVISSVCFGCECSEPQMLERIARVLNEEPEEYVRILKELLSGGTSFPKASAQALEHVLPGASLVISSPNNILGTEYIRALLRMDSAITPVPTARIGAGYADTGLPAEGTFASATAIRTALQTGADASAYMPPEMNGRLACTLFPDDFSSYLNYALLMSTPEVLADTMDMSEDMAARLLRASKEVRSFTEWTDYLKTRNITRARASRALLHLLLGINSCCPPEAVRLLGFRKDTPVLRFLQDHSSIPIVTKLSDVPEELFREDIRASRLYALAAKEKAGIILKDDYLHSPVIL